MNDNSYKETKNLYKPLSEETFHIQKLQLLKKRSHFLLLPLQIVYRGHVMLTHDPERNQE